MFPTGRILESLRFKLDVQKTATANIKLGVSISGNNSGDFALIIRNGVLEFAEELSQNPDLSLELEYTTLLQLLAPSPSGGKHGPVVETAIDRLLVAVDEKQVQISKGLKPDLITCCKATPKPCSEVL